MSHSPKNIQRKYKYQVLTNKVRHQFKGNKGKKLSLNLFKDGPATEFWGEMCQGSLFFFCFILQHTCEVTLMDKQKSNYKIYISFTFPSGDVCSMKRVSTVDTRECPQWTLWAPYGDPLQCCMCFYLSIEIQIICNLF